MEGSYRDGKGTDKNEVNIYICMCTYICRDVDYKAVALIRWIYVCICITNHHFRIDYKFPKIINGESSFDCFF